MKRKQKYVSEFEDLEGILESYEREDTKQNDEEEE